ncbi:MAG: hypothetical protein RLZZ543_2073 [Bacteroidota bacterium]|jgi:hypothetical protein
MLWGIGNLLRKGKLPFSIEQLFSFWVVYDAYRNADRVCGMSAQILPCALYKTYERYPAPR